MLATGTSSLIGAIPTPHGTEFRVWAPVARQVDVVLTANGSRHPLSAENYGYFVGLVRNARAGDRYRFSLDGGDAFPDPASRYQPEGPHGPSEIIDPHAYRWSENESRWSGVALPGQVFYELHIGTFTLKGTYAAAIAQFPRLRDLGITVLECMPICEFAGKVGWGYDGVDLFAPFHGYGSPDDLRGMIDAAHQHGLGIILDAVYNHIGPDGNYLTKYSDRYFSEDGTEWGPSINFDGRDSCPVREFFLANAAHWISEYHFDGLRLDATQSIQDSGSHGTHILAEIGKRARESAGSRRVVLVAENEPQDSRLIYPVEEGGFGLDAVWNDDFHHSAIVVLTGRREAYFSDHLGRPQEFISSAKYGYLYQGQYYSWQQKPRGRSSLHVDSSAFITFLENHDQVANFGQSLHVRLLSGAARYRAVTALWLLSPGTPMFFQGQEYGAETPFHYFANHAGDLANAVSRGRREFMLQFADQDTPEMRACYFDPEDRDTFLSSRLDPSEQQKFPAIVRLHADLLALRRNDPVLNQNVGSFVDGAVLSDNCFVLRYVTSVGQDRLLLVNFGVSLDLPHIPEPLVSPPAGCRWQVLWSSEWPEYGGCGSYVPDRFGPWHIMGECTQLLTPLKSPEPFHPEKPKSGVSK
ncbi:MAG: malto-oligosyltrehalose trehalohydrolase [Silvibacterium sp.]|nr:malto-oligosyltrehalose trehalohydrolase [Silvibacterium sp.]MBV8438338.1 malto-oligosyltrehalose trehalohydrolase [Silvibacterium sp.]